MQHDVSETASFNKYCSKYTPLLKAEVKEQYYLVHKVDRYLASSGTSGDQIWMRVSLQVTSFTLFLNKAETLNKSINQNPK